MLIELSYRFCLFNKSLRELGSELGGISGSGIVRVHERLRTELDKDKQLFEKIAKYQLIKQRFSFSSGCADNVIK